MQASRVVPDVPTGNPRGAGTAEAAVAGARSDFGPRQAATAETRFVLEKPRYRGQTASSGRPWGLFGQGANPSASYTCAAQSRSIGLMVAAPNIDKELDDRSIAFFRRRLDPSELKILARYMLEWRRACRPRKRLHASGLNWVGRKLRPERWPSEGSRERLPVGDGPGALPGLRHVGDQRKQPAELDSGRWLPFLTEVGADCRGLNIGDDEHRRSMETRTSTGKRPADSFRGKGDCRKLSSAMRSSRRSSVPGPRQMRCATPAFSQPYGRYRPNILGSMCLAPLT
jgi:hypothetical protein